MKSLEAGKRYTRELAAVDAKALSAAASGEALAVFEAVITTSTKDRDGDILESKGCNVDPHAPLLFNHDPSLPIGKLVELTERTNDKIAGKLALADTDLGRDCLKLAELGALRISHGFTPTDFSAIKGGGHHVRSWSLVEVSLVACPANVDATIQSIEKFKTPAVKSWASSLVKGDDVTKSLNSNTPAADDSQTTNANANGDPPVAKSLTIDDVKTVVKETVAAALAETTGEKKPGLATKANGAPTVGDLLGDGSSGGAPRVKTASERYSHTTTKAVYPESHKFGHLRGCPVTLQDGRELDVPSQAQKAMVGAWLKFQASRSGLCVLDEHTKGLVDELFEKCSFAGLLGDEWVEEYAGSRVKSLLDDNQSGGLNLNPIWFDDQIVTTPLLTGELFPGVSIVPVPRGRRIEGASMGTPSVTWGVAEGTQIDLFDTTSFVSKIESTIFPVAIAITIGRDLLSDSPAAVQQTLVSVVGEKMTSELDRVVAVGNGSSEPEGLTVASGTNAPSSVNGTGGPIVLADFEAALFGISKAFRQTGDRSRIVFASNDTTYRRSRSLKVDPSATPTDERRLLGMMHESYETLGHRHAIQNDLANSDLLFANLSRYRMYRRQGAETRFYSDGKELARKNETMLIVRGRYGGKVVSPAGVAYIDDLQS